MFIEIWDYDKVWTASSSDGGEWIELFYDEAVCDAYRCV